MDKITCMKKEIKKFVSFFYKKEVETNDSIHYDCFCDILGKGFEDDGDTYPQQIILGKNTTWGREVDHIKIDKVIKILQNLKKSGCNYVEIMHHCDHGSYVFNGIFVRESTPEEIEVFQNLSQKKKEFQKKMDELDLQSKKLKEEYSKFISA